MSYNVTAYTPDTENESSLDVAHIGTTETTELLDAILSDQDYRRDGDYDRTYASSDELKARLVAVFENKNLNYFKLIAFTATEVMRNLNDWPNVLRSVDVDDNIINYWDELIKRHTTDDGELNKKFIVDELLTIETHLADFDDALSDMNWRIGDYAGNSLFYLFLMINTLRNNYVADPSEFEKLTLSIG